MRVINLVYFVYVEIKKIKIRVVTNSSRFVQSLFGKIILLMMFRTNFATSN